MSQCVPNWDVDDAPNPTPIDINALAPSASNSLCTDVPSMDYEVAELTWENGQLAMHGLGAPRLPTKLLAADTLLKEAWEKPRAGGTLESIVSQATCMPSRKRGGGADGVLGGELVPWFDPNNHRQLVTTAENPAPASSSATLTMDALVPCAKPTSPPIPRWPGHDRDPPAAALGFSGHVGSCSVLPGGTRVRGGGGAREMSVSASATYSKDSRQMTMTERDVCTEGFTSTSMASPENTSSEKQCTLKSVDDNDHSVCHSRSQWDIDMDEKKDGKSSVSTKRSRAAATHNQSERKRRDKINQRMKTLQKLVPNSSKTDKASMLDEVIEYLKQLQSQIHMMSRMNMPPAMMFPLAMQQQLQMSMMAPAAAAAMGMNMGMGIAGMMDMNGRSNMAAAMPQLLNPAAAASAAAAFMPMAAAAWWDQGSAAAAADRMPAAAAAPAPVMPDHLAAFLACQSQPMTADAYSRMATMYQQQFQQTPQGGSKN